MSNVSSKKVNTPSGGRLYDTARRYFPSEHVSGGQRDLDITFVRGDAEVVVQSHFQWDTGLGETIRFNPGDRIRLIVRGSPSVANTIEVVS